MIGLFIVFPDIVRDLNRQNFNPNMINPGIRNTPQDISQFQPGPTLKNDAPVPDLQNRIDRNFPKNNSGRIMMDFGLFSLLAIALLFFNSGVLKRGQL
jgi:hypothetical protein